MNNIIDKSKIINDWVKNNSLHAIHSFSSSINIVSILFPLTFSILFKDHRGTIIASGCIFNLLINVLLKHILKVNARYSLDVKKICTIFKDYILPSGSPIPTIDYRMPSEHVQTIGFLLGFFIGKMIVDENFQLVQFMILFLFVILISWSRYNVQCHTLPQIVVGAIIGIALGIGYYYIAKGVYDVDKKEEETENLCLGTDDNEYKCDIIKDGYVVRTGD